MKAIIDGKQYDTGTADKIGSYSHGYGGDFDRIEESLYRYSKDLDTDPAGLEVVLSRLDKLSVLKKK